MARSRINFKSINMEKNNDIYNQSVSQIMNQFRPEELLALLKLNQVSNNTCNSILKLHLQFVKLEAFEYACITRDWIQENCY